MKFIVFFIWKNFWLFVLNLFIYWIIVESWYVLGFKDIGVSKVDKVFEE